MFHIKLFNFASKVNFINLNIILVIIKTLINKYNLAIKVIHIKNNKAKADIMIVFYFHYKAIIMVEFTLLYIINPLSFFLTI